MKFKKESIGNLIKAVIFLMIIFILFLFFTYLFRNTEEGIRGNILQYYEEEENSLDVVVVGASNVARYWNGMRAWEQYGFASRNYATVSMRANTYLYALKDALRTQSPTVVVVEARLFTRDYSGDINVGTRNFFDSLDISPFRIEAINYFREMFDVSWEDSLSLYIDLIQYHDNYAALTDPKHWALADNRTTPLSTSGQFFKGYSVYGEVVVFDDPSGNITDECGKLDSKAQELYIDIIEYCQNNDIPLMFVASPIVATVAEEKRFNTLAKIAESYGIDFVDTNKLYEEMGLDFTRDFYDEHHVNILGADKFTDYFAAYLDTKYDLPDRRNQEEYKSWNELHEEYTTTSDKKRERALNIIAINESAWETEALMAQTDDPWEWLSLSDNSEITLFMMANAPLKHEMSKASQLALKAYGVTDEFVAGADKVKVVYNDKVIYSDSSNEKKSGKVGDADLKFVLSTEEEPQILIGETNYYDNSREGIQVVAFDQSTNKVFDVIYLNVSEDGSLTMQR